MTAPTVTETLVRVNYSETDQMGVAYHARYLVWLDVARTEHLRRRGASYRELETAGLRLAVSEVSVRYRQPARFDDLLRIRCWVRRLESRRVEFGYAVDHAEDGRLLATATVALLALDASMALRRLPPEVARVLTVAADPVRLGVDTAGIQHGGTGGDSPQRTDGIHHRDTEDTEDTEDKE